MNNFSIIKTVIANSGGGGIGKSSAIKQVYEEVKRRYPHLVELRATLDTGDINALISISGFVIGIESQGDPNSRMYASLKDFVAQNCDIIVCACRTKSDTLASVRDLEHTHNYRLIFAQHYINASIKDSLNTLYAKSIVQMIDDIMNGKL